MQLNEFNYIFRTSSDGDVNMVNMFGKSHLTSKYSPIIIDALEGEANSSQVTVGKELYLVKPKTTPEMCVRIVKGKITCQCDTNKRLGLCSHIMAVAKQRGKTVAEEMIIQLLKTGNVQLSTIVEKPSSGKKPNDMTRKGGRTVKKRPHESHVASHSLNYIVVRGNTRISVCQGCRRSLKGCMHAIRHRCAMPYPKRVDGKVVIMTPTTASNHYFHLAYNCVKASIYHGDFNGGVEIDPSVHCPTVKQICIDGGLKLM